MRFVSFVMSEGVARDPLPWEGATSPKVIEIRGGSVYFEAGAVGGNFVNCFFVDDRDVGAVRLWLGWMFICSGPTTDVKSESIHRSLQGLEAAIQQTMDQVTVRIYGGHVFAVSGNINFYNCLIFDLTILYPLTNFLIIGGDVLNLAGTINFVACTWIETTLFGVENGAGLVRFDERLDCRQMPSSFSIRPQHQPPFPFKQHPRTQTVRGQHRRRHALYL